MWSFHCLKVRIHACFISCCVLTVTIVNADTISRNPVADTSLHEINPTFNMGGHTHVSVGTTRKNTRSRGFFKFDLVGQIPANSVVNSVSVVFTVTGTPTGGGASSTFGLHRVLKRWGEGNKTGNIGTPAGTDEATWNARMNPATVWGTPGGAAADDFVATGSVSAQVAGVGQYTFGPSSGLLNDLQGWLQNPEQNFGWVLISQSESVPATARRFGSREAGASAASLIIDFTPPVENVPPVITLQPESQTILFGTTATFSVLAGGTSPITYQWRLNGTDIPGATGATLDRLADGQTDVEGIYTVVVRNVAGSETSAPATLAVLVSPVINSPPRTQAVTAGGSVNFQVIASGTEPLSFQWQFNGADIQGATDATFSLSNVQPDSEGNYTVVVSNISGSLVSAPAALAVLVSPIFSLHPQSQIVIGGTSVTFQAVASGTEPLSYQWQFNGSDIPGATNPALALDNIAAGAEGDYAAVASNSVGSSRSATASLTVLVSPTINTQPESQTVSAGASVVFQVSGSGSEPLNYQWQKNGVDISGATEPALVLTGVQPEVAASYTVVVSNAAGSVTSESAVLTVIVPISIESQPQSQSAVAGADVTFQVIASGTEPLSYQWQFNGADIPGATDATLVVKGVQPEAGGSYTVVVSNAVGIMTSESAVLMVVVPPTIGSQPLSRSVVAGADVTFQVIASGSEPLSYQWQRDGEDIPGAMESALLLAGVQAEAAGSYTVVVSNAAGSVTSESAVLTVIVAPAIGIQPMSQTVVAGDKVVLFVTASGSEPLSYQWQLNGEDIPVAANDNLVGVGVQPEFAGSYTVVVSNAAGSVTSESAILTVIVAPTIGSQPQSQSVVVGADVTFQVIAAGSEPLSYQWRFNKEDIPGATNAALVVDGVQPEEEGDYSVVVSNTGGSVTSAGAQLTIEAVTVSRPQIDRIEFDGNMFTIVFELQANVGVVVEYSESLSAGIWMSLTTIAATPNSETMIVHDSVSTSKSRFYRLRVTE